MHNSKLVLSVLDQSPIFDNQTPTQAIEQTHHLVKETEKFGYKRYWFAEHHGSAAFASASPELMIAHAAGQTKTIRLGTGGILLGHANALQTAERLRTLQALSNNRVDAGFGRAPGGDQRVIKELGYNPAESWNTLKNIQQFLSNASIPSTSNRAVAVPHGVESPELWILGTSVDSAKSAGERGLPYAFGSFIDPTNMSDALRTYHTSFVSASGSAPYTMLALVAFVGATELEANEMAESTQRWFVDSFLRGKDVKFPVVTVDSQKPTYSAMEEMLVQIRRQTALIGTAEQVAQNLLAYKKQFAVNEFMIVTITQEFEARVRSYQLLAEACNLLG